MVLLEPWPSKAWIYRRSVPCSSKWVAKLWRSECGVKGPFIPAFSLQARKTFRILSTVYWPPSCPSNNQSFGRYCLKYDRRLSSHFCDSNVVRCFLPFTPLISSRLRQLYTSVSFRFITSPMRRPPAYSSCNRQRCFRFA